MKSPVVVSLYSSITGPVPQTGNNIAKDDYTNVL